MALMLDNSQAAGVRRGGTRPEPGAGAFDSAAIRIAPVMQHWSAEQAARRSAIGIGIFPVGRALPQRIERPFFVSPSSSLGSAALIHE
jgi:hypothetical protein